MSKLSCVVLALVAFACPTIVAQTHAPHVVPDTAVLKGADIGNVTLNHVTHVKAAEPGAGCRACHHARKPYKPAGVKSGECQNCHTRDVKEPMKTNSQAAFHSPAADAGVCIDCHLTRRQGPTRCGDCHKEVR